MGKRLFIAADISDEARDFAAGVSKALRTELPVKGVSWSRAENLHVTIKFLGDTGDDKLPALSDMLRTAAASCAPFRLQLDRPELLGKRVVSIAVASDSPAVYELEKRIDTKCDRLGFEAERRRFHPHLTLARIRQPENARELGRRFLQTQIEPLGFEVREIVLYESELGPGGSIYKRVESFPLNAPK